MICVNEVIYVKSIVRKMSLLFTIISKITVQTKSAGTAGVARSATWRKRGNLAPVPTKGREVSPLSLKDEVLLLPAGSKGEAEAKGDAPERGRVVVPVGGAAVSGVEVQAAAAIHAKTP